MKTASPITLILVVLGTLAGATGFALQASQEQSAPATDKQIDLVEIPQPDLTNVGLSIRQQIQAAQISLAGALARPDTSSSQRGDAFGRLGQIYQAYGFDDAARAAYTNAAKLASQSYKWHYYSGYLKQRTGDAESALDSYRRAQKLRPKDRCVLLRLGSLELVANRPEMAKAWFLKSMDQPGSGSAAALTGLGKVALAEHQYPAALKYFKEALAREPEASSIHYQLAMTYRALGDTSQMQKEIEARGDIEPTIKDPLLDEIDLLKQGKVALLERATKAMNENRFVDAAASYREMIRIDPNDAIAYHYLGVALAKSGKRTEALESYEHSLQLDPNSAAVHYSIGVLLIQAGKQDRAIDHLLQATRLDPGLVSAHFQLANLLMREGKNEEAAGEYAVVVGVDPRNGFARLMQAMALIHSGDYARARKVLEEGSLALPNDPDIANSLARLLAAAPDPAVRDGDRALRIVNSLAQNQQGDAFEVGVTLAMALAAVGRFKEAAFYQQALIQQVERSGTSDLTRQLRRNLDLYTHQKPCTLPWDPDDPIFYPVPGKLEVSTAN